MGQGMSKENKLIVGGSLVISVIMFALASFANNYLSGSDSAEARKIAADVTPPLVFFGVCGLICALAFMVTTNASNTTPGVNEQKKELFCPHCNTSIYSNVAYNGQNVVCDNCKAIVRLPFNQSQSIALTVSIIFGLIIGILLIIRGLNWFALSNAIGH